MWSAVKDAISLCLHSTTLTTCPPDLCPSAICFSFKDMHSPISAIIFLRNHSAWHLAEYVSPCRVYFFLQSVFLLAKCRSHCRVYLSLHSVFFFAECISPCRVYFPLQSMLFLAELVSPCRMYFSLQSVFLLAEREFKFIALKH